MGANVRLLTGLDLELERRGELVWLWPQGKRSMPPLKLRLIRVKGAAEADVYLLTNVLDTERLSDSTAGAVPDALGRGGLLSQLQTDAGAT